MFAKQLDQRLTNDKAYVQQVIIRSDYQKKTKDGIQSTKEFAVILWHQDIFIKHFGE